MTLSAYLLSQMNPNESLASMPPPNMMPLQTPRTPGGAQGGFSSAGYTASSVMGANDGSQWGAHHGAPSAWGGSQWGGTQGGFGGQPTQGRFTPWSEERIAMMQARLAKKLGPEYVSQRPGMGGGPKLSYLEGWKAINLANDVFGFNGWSSTIISLKTDYMDVTDQNRVTLGITAIIRVTLQDGCFHEDVGYGTAENLRGRSAALEKAQKEAVTDGLKRALKHFGNVMGNCLYDKDYAAAVKKMKVPPAKFNPEELERRPEFTPQGAPRPASAVPSHVNGNAKVPVLAPVPAPAIHRPATERGESPIPRADTPLRSLDDSGDSSSIMDGIEGEFAFMEGDSFFDEFDRPEAMETEVTTPVTNENTVPPPPQANNAPAYQHRHRPDFPAPPVVPTSASSSTSVLRPRSEANGTERKVAGAFAFPSNGADGKEKSAAAASARRAAIIAAAANGSTAEVAPRGSSGASAEAAPPRIPSGGVDGVATRASVNLRTHGQNLEIENTDTPGRYGAFASARGVKRDGSESPTKLDRARPGGPRSALSELLVSPGDPGSDWQSKRSRFM
ncbi:DNA repair and recombination protein rad22 [Vanrija pseudolonga]|uniref:DNA repair and recombination protein rad22 n=1 Tax=Vanrija pseudolonga TaxID=143232 RepID=A0AAF1BHT4_9TREE|nr:DNA repair and recombination protein rad22 [Vanrija pseudolonga]